MRTCALIASIVAVIVTPTFADVTSGLISADPINMGVLQPGGSFWPVSSPLPSTMGVVRLVRLTVTPASPGPDDPVSVKISAQAFSSYLVLDRTTVDKQAGDVTIDLYWSDHTPPAILSGTVQNQITTLGYGIEQIPVTPAAIWANKTYETTEVLGTFAVGAHTIHVYSHGALEGEASALFQVRSPAGIFGDVFWPIDIGGSGDEPESIWSRLGLPR